MKFAKRALLVCALSSTFLLSACYTVHVDESEVSNLESANTSSPDLTNIERNRRAHELERIDSMVKSKPKKRPAENTLYQQRIDEVSRSLRNLCTNPQNKAYFDKTPCLPAGMKRAYLEDNSYPTEVQRIVAARVFKEMNNLNTTTHQIMRSTGNQRYTENANYSAKHVQPRIQTLQQKFLSGKMTWAAYNKERLAIFNDTADRDTTR